VSNCNSALPLGTYLMMLKCLQRLQKIEWVYGPVPESSASACAIKCITNKLYSCSRAGSALLRMQAGAPTGGLHAPASACAKNLITLQAPANAFVHLSRYLLGLRRMQSTVPQTPAGAHRTWRG
jgi:hypothetical protein